MGAGNSKQDDRADHLWKSSGPPSLSLGVLDSLQSDPEVSSNPRFSGPGSPRRSALPDSSRILSRLTRSPTQTDASRAKQRERHIQARVAEELKNLKKREAETLKLARARIAAEADADADDPGPDRFAVGKEVESLRRKLDERKQLRVLPDPVEKTRNNVIRCLRDNDRRPLDCWKEVEAFKAEVKKMEDGWVEKVVS
ncbi:hypothetical protein XA68_17878 [Ophiocordyceps unilateralis]|uniref:DUF1690 domain-containing protein n=1 Tax=Ophiocordyceps unilateralis TaxID=268505 RepID=A0A2A9PJ46_OPHUN|nr:hypothetical protein XA68_17878 [Ophiocordyceps unilateralis]